MDMRKAVLNLSVAFAAAFVAVGASRPMPEYLKSAVVYQIVLHNFTLTGTFKAARAMLDHVRSTGADVVYLTSFFEMDRDMDRKYWSPRQIASGYDSPLNPYRIKDYNKIDPIYGTEAADGTCSLGPWGYVVIDLSL